MIAQVRERLLVSKRKTGRWDLKIFNLRKINSSEIAQYQINISNSFASLEMFNDRADVNIAWRRVLGENTKTSAEESFSYYKHIVAVVAESRLSREKSK
jgi:hypothetical protein